MEMEEEFQEADVLWPWPDTPPPWPVSPPAPEMYDERDATVVVVGFSCEPFSEAEAASTLSSVSTSSARLFDRSSSGSSEDGFFLSGPSTLVSGIAASSEEFLEKDVLWPDDTVDDDDRADDAAGEFWCTCCHRVEKAAPVAAACGTREGWRPLASSPIDIPVPTRTRTRAAAALRRPSPSAVLLHRRR